MSNKTTKWILELVDEVVSPLRGVNREAKLATSIGEELGDTYEGLGSDIKDTGEAAEVAGGDMLGMVDDMLGADFGSISGGLKGIKDGITGITKSGLAFIATPLGITLAGLAVIGLVANDFAKYNNEAREYNRITAQMTQLSGEAVSAARVRGKVTEEVFGQDFKDTLEIAKNNVNAFDISYQEAFDNIDGALVRGAAANEEYLSSMREYPRMFANAGFTMQELQRIVAAGFDLGMYSDKLPDAIKEFTLSINEQTQSSRDALENAFGKKFTEELFLNIERGSKTPKEALLAIAEETEKVGVNAQEAQQLTADLFRGAGEDAGGFLEIIDAVTTSLNDEADALTGLETELNKVYEATREYREEQQKALESDTYIAFAQEMELFWMDIKTGYYSFIIFLQDWFNDVTKFYTQLIATATAVPKVIKETFLNVMEDLGLLVDTFISAGSIINDALHFRFDDAAEGFKNFKADLQDDLLNLGKDILIDPQLKLGAAFAQQGKDVDAYRDGISYFGKEKSKLDDLKPNGGDDVVKDPDKTKTKTASSGSGSGSGKSLTMTLNIVQNFYQTKRDDVEEIATQTVRMINDKLRDAVITVGT